MRYIFKKKTIRRKLFLFSKMDSNVICPAKEVTFFVCIPGNHYCVTKLFDLHLAQIHYVLLGFFYPILTSP